MSSACLMLPQIYNCDDPACYRDLTRLMGLLYLTGSVADVSKVPAVQQKRAEDDNPKFFNYKCACHHT